MSTLEEAKEFLGTNWVRHPDYKFNPRHSNNADIYAQARQPYLTKVIAAAAQDRLGNPAFTRAEIIRRAVA